LAQPIGGIGELQAIEVTEPVGVVMRITFLQASQFPCPTLALRYYDSLLQVYHGNQDYWV